MLKIINFIIISDIINSHNTTLSLHIQQAAWFRWGGLVKVSKHRIKQRKYTCTNNKKQTKSTETVILPAVTTVWTHNTLQNVQIKFTHIKHVTHVSTGGRWQCEWYFRRWCNSNKVTASDKSSGAAGTALLTNRWLYQRYSAVKPLS